jgi:UDP-N-acetylmuramyl pentapeptide phosphotransferase/UDP-N-acetylglucosamine-1-phosphate transferase
MGLHSSVQQVLLVLVGAFAVSALITRMIRDIALSKGIVDQPTTARWHRRPTPILGGVAMFATLLLGSLLIPRGLMMGQELIIWISGLLFAIGLADDVFSIRPIGKLAVQIGAGMLVLHYGWQFALTPWEPVNILLTLFWIVGITNAFNLLDNMDGLSGGIAFTVTLVICSLALLSHQPGVALLSGCIGGVLLGFLWFNFKPASIFMGDSGSLVLGFLLAVLPLAVAPQLDMPHPLAWTLPVIILFVPIFDTTFVTCLRRLSGRSVAQGGKDHTSHLLVGLGISERSAVLLLMAGNLTAGGIAVLLYLGYLEIALFGLIAQSVVALLLGIYLGREWLLRHAARHGESIGMRRMRKIERVFHGTIRRPMWESFLLWGCAALAFQASKYMLYHQWLPVQLTDDAPFIMPPVICAQWGAFLLMGHGRVFQQGKVRTWLTAVLLGLVITTGAVAAQQILSVNAFLLLLIDSALLAVFTVALGRYILALTRHPLKVAASADILYKEDRDASARVRT